MKKNLIFSMAVILFASAIFVSSCKKEYALPVISLSDELIEVNAGETITVSVTVDAEAGLDKVVVTKLHDGTAVGSAQEFTADSFDFTYTVTEDDVDPILSFNFKAIDTEGQEGEKELVVDVALTMTQLLLKYDWLLTSEIRELTGENDISEVYTDDIYRFHADGSYDKSIGAMVDDFSDLWFNYCYWNLDEENSILYLSRTGAFLEDVRDTIMINTIDHSVLEGTVVYYGLDVFNTGEEEVPYEAVENYEKGFSAVAKSENFDPYQAGADDDGGPAGVCNEIEW